MIYQGSCGQCGDACKVCWNCHNCCKHCHCPATAFDDDAYDADELGLDPETDNTPGDPTRHA